MVGTPGEGAAESTAAALDDVAATLMNVWSRPHNAPDVPVPSTQLRALLVLERGPVNISSLAGELGALVSSASRLCDRLEASGLLARDSGRDRREVTVRLSADGRALVGRLRERRQAELTRVLAQMPASARAALLWGLTEFHEAASRRDGEDGSLSMLA
ncbi:MULTISPECIES: MarR family transcriptional regulator [Actinomadura]|uniref:MarR family transcriptional regulator n=1 Tax=Actinomadura geliboluensis TaxID=882440 RepID=A0A5S4GNX4_9ACTN|nr:MarR family transcriptional regulator [Actinomadura geliboluensis]TMR34603.1 MarR family transcriptional regulator [Actinomadura geliboluensis]